MAFIKENTKYQEEQEKDERMKYVLREGKGKKLTEERERGGKMAV